MKMRILLFLISIHAIQLSAAIENETVINKSSFEENRANTNLNLALKLGYIAGGITGSGIDLGYHLNENLIIGAEYLQGKDDLRDAVNSNTSLSTSIDKVSLQAQFYGIYSKYFMGPTFAVTGGVYQRSINSEIAISSNYDDEIFVSTKSKGSATVAKLGIGNYWSWKFGLTLGCEWIGAQVPIANKKMDSSFTVGSKHSSKDKESIQKIGDDLSKTFSSNTTWSLLNVHLGYNF